MTEQNVIKILSDKEHILKRPGMYVGSTVMEEHDRFLRGEYRKISYVPALLKIIDEVIDNAVDEAIRTDFKFANAIAITVTNDTVIVGDNGRGIPHTEVMTPEGDMIPSPVAAWTRTKAGGNFGDDATRKTGGMNGVGSSLTNYFSNRFTGVTCDGKNIMVVECSDGADKVDWTIKRSNDRGTTVSFEPNLEYFGVNEIDSMTMEIIEDRIKTLSVIYPKIKFKYNGRIVDNSFKAYAEQFDKDAIVLDEKICSIAIGTSDDGFRHLSYVNNIHTKVGGTHIDYLINELSDALIPMIKKSHKLVIPKSRIKECLTLVMFIRDMSNMRFDSQTKERLTNPIGEIKQYVIFDAKKLAKKVMDSEHILMPIIESELAKLNAKERALEREALKRAKKAKVPKHIKANGYGDPSKDTTLFLTEGNSAIGFLLETRNSDLQGGYPLRGKVLTSWNVPASKIMSNQEFFDICAIMGLEIGKKAENINYQNIAIMTDADLDGQGAIAPSLICFFSQWKELFDEERIKIVKSPLIICTKGKDSKWYYTLDEFEVDKHKLKGYDIRYIKGLGSLEKHEYAQMIQNPKYEIIELDDNWEEQLEMLYGDDATPRKKWMLS